MPYIIHCPLTTRNMMSISIHISILCHLGMRFLSVPMWKHWTAADVMTGLSLWWVKRRWIILNKEPGKLVRMASMIRVITGNDTLCYWSNCPDSFRTLFYKLPCPKHKVTGTLFVSVACMFPRPVLWPWFHTFVTLMTVIHSSLGLYTVVVSEYSVL